MARAYAIRRKKMSGYVSTLFFALIFFYFTYHMISGRNGLLTMLKLEKQMERANEKLDETGLEKMGLEHRVDMLSRSVDLDLLDEQARKLLNYSTGKEWMIIVPKEDQKAYYGDETDNPAE
jgi:cell division protein FtsB